MALLEVKDLTAAYGGIQALRGVSLTVEEGQIVAVLGGWRFLDCVCAMQTQSSFSYS